MYTITLYCRPCAYFAPMGIIINIYQKIHPILLQWVLLTYIICRSHFALSLGSLSFPYGFQLRDSFFMHSILAWFDSAFVYFLYRLYFYFASVLFSHGGTGDSAVLSNTFRLFSLIFACRVWWFLPLVQCLFYCLGILCPLKRLICSYDYVCSHDYICLYDHPGVFFVFALGGTLFSLGGAFSFPMAVLGGVPYDSLGLLGARATIPGVWPNVCFSLSCVLYKFLWGWGPYHP
jgi:hypothetical protein